MEELVKGILMAKTESPNVGESGQEREQQEEVEPLAPAGLTANVRGRSAGESKWLASGEYLRGWRLWSWASERKTTTR